jgi:hypothetical protein
MRTNPFYDAWLFLIGRTGDHENSGVGPLLTVLFLVLLAASIWIARKNWQQDPSQRTPRHLTIWFMRFMRFMIGAMWFQGSLWKLPLPVSGGFQGWTQALGENAAFEFHRWIAKTIFLPLLPIINPLVYLTELSLAVAFILGFLVRPLSVIGMLFVVQLWLGLYLHPGSGRGCISSSSSCKGSSSWTAPERVWVSMPYLPARQSGPSQGTTCWLGFIAR